TAAGMATGLALSRWFDPTAADIALAFGTSGLGHAFGLGVAALAVPDPAPDSRADAAGQLVGGLGGLLAGSLVARHHALSSADLQAGVLGAGFGGLFGALAPSLHEATWDDDRQSRGGLGVGTALGGAGAAALAHATSARIEEIRVPAIGGVLGAGVGLGVGVMATEEGSQAPRIGLTPGAVGLGVGAGLATRRLGLPDPAPARRPLATVGGGIGASYGMLLADALPRGDSRRGRSAFGGLLAGGSLGVSAGLVAPRWIAPTSRDLTVAIGGATLGAGLGLGTARLALASPSGADSAFTLVGSAG